jgi:hypothetical protein
MNRQEDHTPEAPAAVEPDRPQRPKIDLRDPELHVRNDAVWEALRRGNDVVSPRWIVLKSEVRTVLSDGTTRPMTNDEMRAEIERVCECGWKTKRWGWVRKPATAELARAIRAGAFDQSDRAVYVPDRPPTVAELYTTYEREERSR